LSLISLYTFTIAMIMLKNIRLGSTKNFLRFLQTANLTQQ